MLILQVNLSLIRTLVLKNRDLKKFNDKLIKVTKSLSSSKSRLKHIKKLIEQKNKDLEDALEDFYALRVDYAKNQRVKVSMKRTKALGKSLML